jgi:hypothetical protein
MIFLPTLILIKNFINKNERASSIPVPPDLPKQKNKKLQGGKEFHYASESLSPKTIRFPDKWFIGLSPEEISRYFLLAKMQLLRSELQLLQDNLDETRKDRTNTMIFQEEE